MLFDSSWCSILDKNTQHVIALCSVVVRGSPLYKSIHLESIRTGLITKHTKLKMLININDSEEEEKSALPSQKKVTFFGHNAST